MDGYYCDNCKKFVKPTLGEFNHPHTGNQNCLICPTCKKMIYPKKLGEFLQALKSKMETDNG